MDHKLLDEEALDLFGISLYLVILLSLVGRPLCILHMTNANLGVSSLCVSGKMFDLHVIMYVLHFIVLY